MKERVAGPQGCKNEQVHSWILRLEKEPLGPRVMSLLLQLWVEVAWPVGAVAALQALKSLRSPYLPLWKDTTCAQLGSSWAHPVGTSQG